jgi:hypothetical protein
MKHFKTEEWVDFVRGKVGKDQKEAMQMHLESGCKRCQREAGTWQRVREAAKRQMAIAPEDSVVRFVKGSFGLRADRHAKRSRGFLAQLIFDSSLEPLPAGVRASAATSRQLLFGAENLRIDLRLEPQIDSESVALIGQVLDAEDPGKRPAPVTVTLLNAGKLVAETKTNRFGEFQLGCGPNTKLELRLKLPLGKEVSIFLIDPIARPNGSSPQYNDSKRVNLLLEALKSTRKKV